MQVPDTSQLPGHMWRTGKAADCQYVSEKGGTTAFRELYPDGVAGKFPEDVKKSTRFVPKDFRFDRYKPQGDLLYPPAEDEDVSHYFPAQPDAPEAEVCFRDPPGQGQKVHVHVWLTKRVDLD